MLSRLVGHLPGAMAVRGCSLGVKRVHCQWWLTCTVIVKPLCKLIITSRIISPISCHSVVLGACFFGNDSKLQRTINGLCSTNRHFPSFYTQHPRLHENNLSTDVASSADWKLDAICMFSCFLRARVSQFPKFRFGLSPGSTP